MKLSRLTTLAAALLTLGAFSFSAHADEYGAEYSLLSQTIRAAQSHCEESSTCQMAGLDAKVLFDASTETNALNPQVVAQLRDIAFSQAQIWADTILEGDYEAAGHTQLDKVEGIYAGDRLIAYRITYSERGWYVGDCSYDYENKASLKECQEGRIVESSFVSPQRTAWLRDDFAYADFVE